MVNVQMDYLGMLKHLQPVLSYLTPIHSCLPLIAEVRQLGVVWVWLVILQMAGVGGTQ